MQKTNRAAAPETNIIKFPIQPLKTRETTQVVSKSSRDTLVTYTAAGDSLSQAGIFDGDILISKSNFDAGQITPRTLCIIKTNGNDCLGKYLEFFDDKVTVSAANRDYPPRTLLQSEIEIKGIVIAVQRDIFY